MKNIIKIFTLLIALLTVTNTADARLRGDAATRVTTGSIIGGELDFYADAKCETKLGTDVAAGSTVYIRATADYDKRLGAADANGKVSFITAEQTINSSAAQTRGEISLGDYVDVVLVESRLDVGIYKLVMPTDANIGVKVSAQFADPAPNQSIQFTSIADKYSVDENAAVGTLVAQITVVDKTKADGEYESLNYTITCDYNADEFNELFEVNEVNNFGGVRTVEIRVKNQDKLDFEQLKPFTTKLYVVNELGDYNIARFYININDLNEDFTLDNQTFTLAEKQEDGSNWQAGKEIANIKLTSQENISEDHFIWKVITTGTPFNLALGTNRLVLTDGSVLDYETKPTWTFKISASDGVYTHNATITVNLKDVNEAPQTAERQKEYTVNENSAAGTELGVLKVFDCDKDDVLSYSLENTDLNGIFELQEKKVNAGTRTVSLVVKDASKLDYEKLYKSSEENATYPITITTTDTDGNSASVKTYIAIEDVNEDLTATGGTFYLNEHSPVGSRVYIDKACQTVGKVSAEDKDLYHADFRKLSYKMSTNNTGTDAEKFKVDPRSGVITSAAEFDLDKDKPNYQFYVNVSDGEFSKDVEVNVNINDIEEPTISWGEADVYVKENTAESEEVVKLDDIIKIKKENDEELRNSLDKIVGEIVYTIDQELSGSAKDLFDIDDKGYIILKSSLDFETAYPNNTFTITVVASGKDSQNNTVQCKINLKIVLTDENEAPSVKNLETSVSETATSVNGSIGKITATDPDANSDSSWGFAKLRYMLEKVLEVNGSTDFPFEINENTGDITVREGETFNYAKQQKYQFKVMVTDCPVVNGVSPLSSTATITINLTDINRAPKFVTLDNVYEVEENVETDTPVDGGNIVAYDEDDADLDKLVITINSDLFEVVQMGKTDNTTHESKFVITTKTGLNYEALYKSIDKDAIFNVTLTITDTEGNTTSKDCQIRVIDVNEAPVPAYYQSNNIEAIIPENVSESIYLNGLVFQDPDVYNTEYGTLYYSLEGDDAALFTIAPGEIFSKINGVSPDYETKDTYQFNIVVTDKEHTVKVPVTVNVGNVNEGPVFEERNPVLLVDEYAEIGSKVGTVSANDDDIKNGKTAKHPTYSLEATDDAADDYKAFEIGKSTGVINVKADKLDNFNTKHEYNVRVVATDGDDPTLTDYVDVVIKAQLKLENLFSADNAFTSYVAPDNMAVPEGLSAYAVVDINGTSATIQQIDYLPQSVPVLIKRADKTENLYKATTGNGTAFYVNKLMINETDREVSAGELYLLYRDEFVLTSSGTLPAGSVYLPITDLAVKTRSLTIGNGEGTTSIENLTPALSESEREWYDLQGRRLGSKPNRKGIYISNGRKVVIK